MTGKMSKIKQTLVRVYTEILMTETSAVNLNVDVNSISGFIFTSSVYHFIAFVLFLSLSLIFFYSLGVLLAVIL